MKQRRIWVVWCVLVGLVAGCSGTSTSTPKPSRSSMQGIKEGGGGKTRIESESK